MSRPAFMTWAENRTRMERLRCIELRRLFDLGDDDGVVALVKESCDERTLAIESGIIADCRACTGTGSAEWMIVPACGPDFLDPEAPLEMIKLETTHGPCPTCCGRGFVAGGGQ